MNRVILMGRLTRDPEIRYSQNSNDQMAVARFTLAVDRRFKRDGENTADFISCVAFGKTAEFMSRYTHQGTKLCVEGRIQTGSYVKQDGTKVYTTDVVIDNAEFAESKAAEAGRQSGMPQGQWGGQNQGQGQWGGQNQGQWQGQNQGQGQWGGQSQGQQYQQYQQPSQPSMSMQNGQGYNQSYGQGYGQSYGQQGYSQSYGQQGGSQPSMPAQSGQGFGQSGDGQSIPASEGPSGAPADDPQSFMEPPVSSSQEAQGEGFMSIPDAVDDEGLPFG